MSKLTLIITCCIPDDGIDALKSILFCSLLLMLLLMLMLLLRAIVGGNCRILAGKGLSNVQSYPSYKARMNDNRRQNDKWFLMIMISLIIMLPF